MINNWTDDKAVVPLPKDNPSVQAFKERYGLKGKFIVMYSGNLGLYYDLPNILKVIAKFRDRDDVVFAFVGEGAIKSQLELYVEDEQLTNVVFIPYQPKNELVYSLNSADVHLVTNAKGIKGVSCPSKAYGIMATNVPMIGILEPGSEIWQIIEESDCGVLAETGNYIDIERVFRRIINEKEIFVSAHSTGRSFLEKGLTKAKAIEQYTALFLSV